VKHAERVPSHEAPPRPAATSARPAPALGLTPATVLALQRTAGNAAVASLMRSHTHAETQPPLTHRHTHAETQPGHTGPVRVVEVMPTITEPGVTYVIGRPDKRYTFELAYSHRTLHYTHLSSSEVVEKLRQVWAMLGNDLDRQRAEHQGRWNEMVDHLTRTWAIDAASGGHHMPTPSIWDKVRRGSLAEALATINRGDDDVKRDWAQDRAQARARSGQELEREGSRTWALERVDPTEQRIRFAAALLERAGADLDDCQRQLDEYLEHSRVGAARLIRGIKITIMVLGAVAGGAGAAFAGEGAGLLAQAAWGAGTMGFVGAVEETASQLGEIHYGLRDHFDVAALGKRVTRDVVLGFVGGVVGGKFSQVLKNRLGGWIANVSDVELAAKGLTREDLLTNYERLFMEWAGGSLGSSPFTTTAGTVLDRALDGELHVQTWGDFADKVFDQLIKDGEMGGFLTAIGHAGAKHGRVEPAVEPRRPSTGHPRPPKTPKPVIEESPPGGFEPTTKEPAPEDYGPAPHVQDIVLPGEAPKRETRINNDPKGFTRRHYKNATELRKDIRKALRELRKKTAAQGKRGRREIDALIERIKAKHPAFAEKVRRYYAALENPRWVEEQMVHLWEQARDHGRTPAHELEHILGADKHGINEFKNDFSLDDKAAVEDFRKRVVENPGVFVDMQEAGSVHGAHTHAFQQYLGDRLFGAGEGLKFRQELATLDGTGSTVHEGQADVHEEPLWASTWDELFDADGNMHSPEELGPILQQYLDFPRWKPGD
jgi:hypothetical protein